MSQQVTRHTGRGRRRLTDLRAARGLLRGQLGQGGAALRRGNGVRSCRPWRHEVSDAYVLQERAYTVRLERMFSSS